MRRENWKTIKIDLDVGPVEYESNEVRSYKWRGMAGLRREVLNWWNTLCRIAI